MFNIAHLRTASDFAHIAGMALACAFYATEDTAAQVQSKGYFDVAYDHMKGPTPVLILAKASSDAPELLLGTLTRETTKVTKTKPARPFVKFTAISEAPTLDLAPLVERMDALEKADGDSTVSKRLADVEAATKDTALADRLGKLEKAVGDNPDAKRLEALEAKIAALEKAPSD